MSTLSKQDHLNPNNPLYYAPRWLRERPETPSTLAPDGSGRAGRTARSGSSFDALLEGAVADALRHPLDPEVIQEPPGFARERDRQSDLISIAGRFAAAIGVSAIVALFFVIMVPASRDHARQPDEAGSSSAGILQWIKTALYQPRQRNADPTPAISEFQTILASTRPSQPTHEQSETLLQQFLQWQQKPASTDSPSVASK